MWKLLPEQGVGGVRVRAATANSVEDEVTGMRTTMGATKMRRTRDARDERGSRRRWRGGGGMRLGMGGMELLVWGRSDLGLATGGDNVL